MIHLETHRLLECLRMLNPTSERDLKIICLEEVDSTQRFLKDYPETSGWVLCMAETQTQGRGRLGRQWYSAQSGQIYATIRLPAVAQQGLSLVVGLALRRALNHFGSHEVMLKWPNDLLWKGKKLAGILIEVSRHSVILGIGLNVIATNYPGACALSEIFKGSLDRHMILANMILQLESDLPRFMRHGLSDFMSEWEVADALMGRELSIRQGTLLLTGVACGINLQGELLLQDVTQKIHAVNSGELITSLS